MIALASHDTSLGEYLSLGRLYLASFQDRMIWRWKYYDLTDLHSWDYVWDDLADVWWRYVIMQYQTLSMCSAIPLNKLKYLPDDHAKLTLMAVYWLSFCEWWLGVGASSPSYASSATITRTLWSFSWTLYITIVVIVTIWSSAGFLVATWWISILK